MAGGRLRSFFAHSAPMAGKRPISETRRVPRVSHSSTENGHAVDNLWKAKAGDRPGGRNSGGGAGHRRRRDGAKLRLYELLAALVCAKRDLCAGGLLLP